MSTLHHQFGDIDIYLFDQLLRGRILPDMSIFDAGCGVGRNLVYFFHQRYTVSGCDPNPDAIAQVRRLGPGDFRAEAVEDNTFAPASADVVLSSAVLHFSRDHAHFRAMLHGSWRVLKPGGLFFCRLASSIGLRPDQLSPRGEGRYLLPDGSERYLVDEALLEQLAEELDAEPLDPLKTTVVQNQRSMTTWVLCK